MSILQLHQNSTSSRMQNGNKNLSLFDFQIRILCFEYVRRKAWNTMQGRTKITAQAAYAYLVENWLEDGDAFGSNTGQFHSSSSTSSSSLLGPVQSKPRW